MAKEKGQNKDARFAISDMDEVKADIEDGIDDVGYLLLTPVVIDDDLIEALVIREIVPHEAANLPGHAA